MITQLLYHPVIAPTLMGILGAILGSFIAALVSRWPQGRSVLAGRSQCDGCAMVLKPWHLIPVLSFVGLRGRCAACGQRIDRDALWIELIAAGVGALSMMVHPGWHGLAMAIFGWLLLPLAWLDLRHFWLPHLLTLALATAGFGAGTGGIAPDMLSRIIGGCAGFAGLWLVAAGYRHLRGRDGLGGGDPLLLGAIGLWLGWQALPMVLLGASGAGLMAALVMQRRGADISTATRFPLGTLLALAAWPVALLSLPG